MDRKSIHDGGSCQLKGCIGSNGNLQYRLTQLFDVVSTHPFDTAQFADECGKTGTITGGLFLRHLCFDSPTAVGTIALLEDKVADFHINFGQFDVLMHVERLHLIFVEG